MREDVVDARGALFGAFGKSKNRRLVGIIDATLDYVGPGGSAASVRATTRVERVLGGGASDRTREIEYFTLLEELARAFDVEMKLRIEEAFRPVFRQAA